MLTTLVAAALIAVQAYLLFNAAFLYYPMLGALLDRLAPRRARETPTLPPSRLAVLIAAHDEGRVIEDTLRAIAYQRYPRDGYAVFVVADNCSDDTAEVARRAGATVYQRFSEGPSTKGQALHFLWSQIRSRGFGGVVVLDADNQADPGFLAALASELGRGQLAVQGLRRAKNAEGGTAGLDALTELCSHRVGAAGRVRLGLNGPLMGSGVAYQAALFDRLISEVGQTVVEDCEWQARLAVEGLRIAWTPRAVVHDEKTARAQAMGTQRDRWMAGRGQVARAYVGPLLKAFLTRGNLSALDMACYLVTPPRVLVLAGFAGMAALALAAPGLPGIWPAGVWIACCAGFGLYVCLGLWLDGAPPRAYWAIARGALQLPRFAWQMARATWKALIGQRVRWVPTPHGR